MKLKNSKTVDTILPIQHLLVKSCLATKKEERESAVRDWEKQVAINDLDFSSSRLIPFFLHGNQQLGISTIHDKRLKIIYKHWWLRTQHISHELEEVHAAFVNAGIETMVIKGASIKAYYELEELRPMADFDLLIHHKDLPKALEIVKYLDYLPDKELVMLWERDTSLLFDFNHSIHCTHKKNKTEFDLHWQIGAYCSAQFTEALWDQMEDYGVIPFAKKPRLAYEVFMLITHAVASDNNDNLNWIIDTVLISQKAPHSFWEEARALAIAEKKEDMFDYGCFILNQYGVYTLNPGPVKKKRMLILTGSEERKNMSSLRLYYLRIRNMVFSVNRLFPHAKPITKLYYLARHVRFSFITRNIRNIK
jgi:hypothetical protein